MPPLSKVFVLLFATAALVDGASTTLRSLDDGQSASGRNSDEVDQSIPGGVFVDLGNGHFGFREAAATDSTRPPAHTTSTRPHVEKVADGAPTDKASPSLVPWKPRTVVPTEQPVVDGHIASDARKTNHTGAGAVPADRPKEVPERTTSQPSQTVPESTTGPHNAAVFPPCTAVGNVTQLVRSPVDIYVQGFSAWLHETPYQLSIASASVTLGLLLAFSSPSAWCAIFSSAVALAAAAIAAYESNARDFDALTTSVVVVQVASALAFATYSGFEGSQVLFGATLGFATANISGDWARYLDAHWIPGFALFWCSAGGIFGIWVLTAWRNQALATLGPLAGSLLVATGVGYIASQGCAFWAPSSPLRMLLPASDLSWASAIAPMQGPDGLGVAIARYASCCVFSVIILWYCKSRRWLSVLGLVGYIVVVTIFCIRGSNCRGEQCPTSVDRRMSGWPISGCLLWIGIASGSAWRQLGRLKDTEESEDPSRAWQLKPGARECPRSRSREIPDQNELPEIPDER